MQQEHQPTTTSAAPCSLSLPGDWDLGADVAVLVGSGWDDVATELLARGQQRLILFLPEDAPEPALAHPASIARRRVDVLQAIMNLSAPLPRRMILRASGDPWATDERLTELGARVRECLHATSLMRHSIDAIGKTSLTQGLGNLPAIAERPSIAGLDGIFAGKPCVLVSPGPSLSKNVHLLRELEGHALLMTGTHALSSFRRAGVTPDLVLAADPGDLARHCAGFDLSRIAALLVSTSCRSSTFELAAPRRFTFAGNAEVDDWLFEALDEDARLRTGGSVACSAFSLAVRLGCDPIVLVGQDLSFSGGRYYAEDSLDGSAAVMLDDEGGFHLQKPDALVDDGVALVHLGDKRFAKRRKVVEVPGYHGGTVQSSEAFRAYLFWFEAMIEALRVADGAPRVWNCTEGGARIDGARQRTLARALPELVSHDVHVGAALDARAALFDPSARRARLHAHFSRTLADIDLCLALAARCKAAIPEAARDAWGLSRFEALEARLRDAVRPLRCIPLVAQREIAAAIARANRSTDLESNLAAAKELFEVFESAAAFVRAPMQDALDALAAPRTAG